MRRWLLLLFTLILGNISILGQETEAGFLRFAHSSIDAPAVVISLGDVVIWRNTDFPVVTDWAQLGAGTYTITVSDPENTEEQTLFRTSLQIDAGQWVTLILTGYAGRNSLMLHTLVEEYATIERGETRITVFHAVPDMPPVDIFADGIEVALRLGYIGNLPEDERLNSVDLVAGRYVLSALDDVGAELVASNDVTFGAERAYLFVVAGTPSNPQYVLASTDPAAVIGGEQAEAVVTGDGPLSIRVGHFAPGLTLIDLYLDGERLLPGLNYGMVTDYMGMSAGTYEAAIVPAGEPLENAVYTGELALVENSITLVAAIGYEVNGTLRLVTAREESDPVPPGLTRIAFFQAIRSNALYDLQLNDNTLIQGLAFPDIFTGAGDGYVSVDLAPGSYSFTIRGDNRNIDAGTVQTGAGRVYLVVALGTPDNPTYRLVPASLPE